MLRIFFFSIMLLPMTILAQNPFIQHYTTSNGLPSNNVSYIFQDSKKFIWMGTSAGVVRYDGSTFTSYKMKDGLSHISVNWIKEDAIGRIWFRGSAGKLDFFYQDKIYNEKNALLLDSLNPHQKYFFQDKDLKMYFYSYALYYFNITVLDTNKKITRYVLDPRALKTPAGEKYQVFHISKSAKGEFIFWTNHGLVTKKNINDTLVLSSKYNKYFFRNVFFTREQTCLCPVYNKKTGSVKLYKFQNDLLTDSLEISLNSSYYITSVIDDKTGMLWVSTIDKGVFCIKNKKIVYHFDFYNVSSMIEDHENNIWIGSRDGVYKISPFFFLGNHYDKSHFNNKGINALSSNPGNGVWCSSGENIYLIRRNQLYPLNFQDRENVFYKIFGLRNNCLVTNGLFMNSHSSSLSSDTYCAFTGLNIDPATKTVKYRNVYRIPATLPEIVFNKNEDEFYTSNGSMVITILPPEKKFKVVYRFGIQEGISNIFINVNNHVIVNGITKNYIILKKRKVSYNELSSIDGKVIYNHVIISDSADLFSTEDDSIYLLQNKQLMNLTSCLDYPVDVHRRRLLYEDPSLYMATLSNIFICDYPLNIFRNKTVKLKIVDINFNNINDILISNDSLYVASEDGLTVIPEVMIRKHRAQTPIPYFSSVQVNDKETSLSKHEIILTGNNKIRFRFGAINYSSTPVFFSYKLQGIDMGWTTGTTKEIVYSNLPAGNFVFLVRAYKPASLLSNPIEYHITIKAHFWQRPIFFVLLAIILTGLIFLIIIRRKNIQIRRRELDHQLITLEQQALQSMMNPHFIFNSLGSIQNYLLQKKSGEAGLYLSQFARLIRQNLNAINSANINLEEEIDRLKNYLDLEKLRMENKFDYTFEVAENVEADELQIPSMIIQPFVENAIWHGIALIEDKGQIVIRFLKQDEKSITVIIEDNGIGMTQSKTFTAKREKHLHLGMEMTRKRLEILGRKFSVKTYLKFSEMFPGNPNPGTRVEMVMPVGV